MNDIHAFLMWSQWQHRRYDFYSGKSIALSNGIFRPQTVLGFEGR